MKRIAIVCDGTWNRHDAKTPTSVVRLAQSVRPEAEDGVSQFVIYVPGVGIGQGVTWMSRQIDRLVGGAFGKGLDDRILEAYRALVFTYKPGDEIYVFGFSRGAYTARSLVGLIRTAGILPAESTRAIPEAMALYRERGGVRTLPDSPYMLARRFALSPHLATSAKDRSWRKEKHGKKVPRLRIAYLGVWDTVGALGLPHFVGLWAKLVNDQYAFHDAALSSIVLSARHAVAIDERRRHFPPSIWDNLDCLNERAHCDPPRYLQHWFPGNHSIVGGSGPVPELSAFPAQWIAEGARQACGEDGGLDYDRAKLIGDVEPDACADDKAAPQRAGLKNLFGWMLGDRLMLSNRQRSLACRPGAEHLDVGTVFPARRTRRGKRPPVAEYDIDQVSEAAQDRVRGSDYHPLALATLIDDIMQTPDDDD